MLGEMNLTSEANFLGIKCVSENNRIAKKANDSRLRLHMVAH
jgi:hypothetical protein